MLLPPTCPLCGATGAAPCPDCRAGLTPACPVEAPPGLDSCRAWLRYDGATRRLVIELKYRNGRRLLPWAAAALAGRAPAGVDVVTWPPTSGARRRARGFDQAELLARRVASRLGCPARRTLQRGAAGHQTGRSRAGRLSNPDFRPVRQLSGRVLVVDDVVTTGATMAAAAAALRFGGADHVHGLAFAARPAPGSSGPTGSGRWSQ